MSSKRTVLQCDCHAFHFLTFEWWPDEKWSDIEAWIAIGGADWTSLRKRIKMAWHCLKGGEPTSEYEVVLQRDKVIELRNNLNDYLQETQGQSNVSGMV